MFGRNRKANYDFECLDEENFKLEMEFDIEKSLFSKALKIARKKGEYKEVNDRNINTIELDSGMFWLVDNKVVSVIKKINKDILKSGYSIVSHQIKEGILTKKGGFWQANLYFYGKYLKTVE